MIKYLVTMAGKKNYTDVLLEDINSKFDAVLEAVGSMQDSVTKIPDMAERLINVEEDMSTLKSATKATNQDIQQLGQDVGTVKIRVEKIDKQLDRDRRKTYYCRNSPLIQSTTASRLILKREKHQNKPPKK